MVLAGGRAGEVSVQQRALQEEKKALPNFYGVTAPARVTPDYQGDLHWQGSWEEMPTSALVSPGDPAPVHC